MSHPLLLPPGRVLAPPLFCCAHYSQVSLLPLERTGVVGDELWMASRALLYSSMGLFSLCASASQQGESACPGP